MGIKGILESAILAIEYTRRMGNTTALVDMLKQRENGILFTVNQNHFNMIKRDTEGKVQTRTVSNIDTIMGMRVPIFFDNAAIYALVCDAARRIRELENDLKIANEDNNLLSSTLRAKEREIDHLKRCIEVSYSKLSKIEGILNEND